jgi:transaldolase
MTATDPLAALEQAGVPIWLDDLSRDELREVYDRTGGQDGRVSIEVDPRLAHDSAATVADRQALWWAVLSRLDALGIDLDEALQKLEHDGVSTFEGAWSQLGEQLSSTLRSTARSGWAS